MIGIHFLDEWGSSPRYNAKRKSAYNSLYYDENKQMGMVGLIYLLDCIYFDQNWA